LDAAGVVVASSAGAVNRSDRTGPHGTGASLAFCFVVSVVDISPSQNVGKFGARGNQRAA